MYIACADTNTQRLIDLLQPMFGDLNIDTTKALCQEVAKAEEASVMAEHPNRIWDSWSQSTWDREY